MAVQQDDLQEAIHKELRRQLVAADDGTPVSPPPDVDASLQRIAAALASALLAHLVQKAEVTVGSQKGTLA